MIPNILNFCKEVNVNMRQRFVLMIVHFAQHSIAQGHKEPRTEVARRNIRGSDALTVSS